MHVAQVDGAAVRFPGACVRCGRPPAQAHALEVSRGLDLLFVHFHEVITVPVPICRACRRRRRWAGALAWAGTVLFILGGGLLVMDFVFNEWKAAAAGLGLAVLAVAVGARFWMDDLVEWLTLGLRVAWKRGPGVTLEIRFRRDAYFAAWSAVNPGARVRTDP